MEDVKSLEAQRRGTLRRRGSGTARRWRRELGRPSSARELRIVSWSSWLYNRW